jgi:hypothetical protein
MGGREMQLHTALGDSPQIDRASTTALKVIRS